MVSIDERPKILLLSGRMGSGKDTTAIPLARSLWGMTPVRRIAYADALRVEIDDIIGILRRGGTDQDLRVTMQCTADEAAGIRSILEHDVLADLMLTSYDHTPTLRKALQYWGTEVRRKHYPDYWVDKTEETIRKALGEGKSVVITDGRFPNELDLIVRLHGIIIRLDIGHDEQLNRIIHRDGVVPSIEALTHYSETALDDYTNFDVRVRVDNLDPSEVILECVRKLEELS